MRVLFMRFETRKYREDFAGLSYQVIDREESEIVDDAMSAEEATDLADAMNFLAKSLDAYLEAVRAKRKGNA